MATLRFADALAALTAAFAASGALAGITVAQGSAPTAAADPEFVIVGHDGSLDPDGSLAEVTETGTFDAAYNTLGAPPAQEETGTINVVAVSQTGDSSDLPGRVTEVQRVAAACADACADLRTGVAVFDTAGSGRVFTRQTVQGCAAIVSFAVTYTAPW